MQPLITMLTSQASKRCSVHAQPFTFTPPSSHPFSNHVSSNLQTALHNGWTSATISSYSHHVHLFNLFCDAENIPHHQRFPTDELVLCAFAASKLGTILGDTARKHISGLKAWHAFHNAPWHGGQRLSYVLNGVSRFTPPSSTRAPRVPINKAMIKTLHDNLNLNSPFDTAIYACATIAFWGQC